MEAMTERCRELLHTMHEGQPLTPDAEKAMADPVLVAGEWKPFGKLTSGDLRTFAREERARAFAELQRPSSS